MLKYVNKILENHCNKVSNESKIEGIGIDSYSREFNLSTHLSILATGIIKKNDLTDMAYNNGISKSQLSKLNNKGHTPYLRRYSTAFLVHIYLV